MLQFSRGKSWRYKHVGAQGFSLNKEKKIYVKRVKYAGHLTHDMSYEEVMRMVAIPMVTPSGTP